MSRRAFGALKSDQMKANDVKKGEEKGGKDSSSSFHVDFVTSKHKRVYHLHNLCNIHANRWFKLFACLVA